MIFFEINTKMFLTQVRYLSSKIVLKFASNIPLILCYKQAIIVISTRAKLLITIFFSRLLKKR